MTLFDALFYSSRMLAVFSDESRLQRMLDFECALAAAEADLGLIPSEASRIIAETCKTEFLDLEDLRRGAALAGNLAIPLVKQLTKAVGGKSAEAAGVVHWSATSQDVLDTGFVLQMRVGLSIIDEQLHRLNAGLAAMAEREAKTPMPGRTWLQQAVPITFGWKAAGWLDAMLRHQTRLREARVRALTLQFGGAAGTLASLGADGLNGAAVTRRLADLLKLEHPDISWHTERDRFGEVAALLGLIMATLGKMARDVSLLMQTEVGELFEGAGEGRGGSSTMPQKRNPVACSAVLAAAVRVPGLVATVLSSMVQEHERGLGNWQAEWETLPEIFNLCAGGLEKMNEIITGLEVDGARMAANLEMTRGLIFAEAVSMAVAPQVGKPAAHTLVEEACRVAIAQQRHLRAVLLEDFNFTKLIPEEQFQQLFDPSRYLGITRRSIDLVLAQALARGIETQGPWVDLADVRIHCKWSGQADKPVLVLSHSLGADLTMWDGQIAEFSKHFRILRYDTRGHGLSSTPPGPYSMERLGSDVVAMLDALGIESCSFCGLSMGGMIGQWLGLNAAPRIHRLVLSNTAAKIGTEDGWNARIAAIEKEKFQSIIPGVLERWFTPEFMRSQPEAIARIRKTLAATDPAGYLACCPALRDADFRSDLPRIQVPALVIAGAHDPATPPSDGRSLADNLADAQFLELNASHMSNIEAADDFTKAVLKFLLS